MSTTDIVLVSMRLRISNGECHVGVFVNEARKRKDIGATRRCKEEGKAAKLKTGRQNGESKKKRP